ncbi:MAG: hypothetical protein PHR14_10000 [Oscillospiraceae bacterium]|nr:hypothetical protein [Oscillospiraceae bacterium]
MDIRAMKPEERNYTYLQSQQISMQTGLIGHLRADMDTDGNGFFSSWDDFRKDLKTQEFKDEFDKVINELRESGNILSNRSTLSKYCYSHSDASFGVDSIGYEREYGVRADTDKYAYMMRLNPHKGEYNLYCYCYRRDWLDGHLEKAAEGIRFIDSHYKDLFRVEDGDKIIITYPDGEKKTRTCRYIDQCHCEIGDNLYHICQFAEIMEKNRNSYAPEKPMLPEVCHSTLPSSGELIVIKFGESGYFRSEFSTDDAEQNRMFADDRNKKQGITKAQEAAMLAGSLYGWFTPAANPKNYNRQGHPVKPTQKKDRGDAR